MRSTRALERRLARIGATVETAPLSAALILPHDGSVDVDSLPSYSPGDRSVIIVFDLAKRDAAVAAGLDADQALSAATLNMGCLRAWRNQVGR